MDIVERLRLGGPNAWEIYGEAADEIKRLRADFESGMERFYSQGAELDNARAEIERLRAALRPFADPLKYSATGQWADDIMAARRALEPTSSEPSPP